MLENNTSSSVNNQITLKSFNKAGFTLAEVLITLGIIGVVAAMTIPNLMTNIQGARTRTQLKKAISTLNQVARMNLAQYDWDFAAISTDCGQTGDNSASQHPESDYTMCALIGANLTGETYLGNLSYHLSQHQYPSSSGLWNDHIGSDAWFVLFQLADGAIIGINRHATNCTTTAVRNRDINTPNYCTGFIDVNGKQLPNTEIQCSDSSKTKAVWENDYSECVVKFSGRSGDIFPILFYDSTVEPSTNAGKYVLNTSK